MTHRTLTVLLLALAVAAIPSLAQAQLNLYCSSPNTAWCQGMANGFEKATGTQVSVIQKATGEMFAQIKAERACSLQVEDELESGGLLDRNVGGFCALENLVHEHGGAAKKNEIVHAIAD